MEGGGHKKAQTAQKDQVPVDAPEGGGEASSAARRSRKARWAGLIFSAAGARGNQAARSISGNVLERPERGGHSSVKVLLTRAVASRSAATAKPWMSLPPACRIVPSSTNEPAIVKPVSSVNS